MEIGNEISQKIRSAIKAKLVDLGAYVDDELPDYIMVMVANKKTEAQMTEDLNLFLGIHTDKFTSWLHNLLCKLQSITADIDSVKEDHGVPTKEEIDLLASADKTRKQETVKHQEESQLGSSAAGDKNFPDKTQLKDSGNNKGQQSLTKSSNNKTVASKDKTRNKSESTDEQQNEGSKNTMAETKLMSKTSTEKGKEKVSSKPKSPVADVSDAEEDEPEIRLRPEHDEFEEEITQDADKSVQQKVSRKHASDARAVKEGSSKRLQDSCLEGVVKDALLQGNEKIARQTSPKRSIKRKSSETYDKSSQEERPSIASRLGKKHRSLSSRVGAVIKHDVYDSEDEYDPFNPSVGNVASVVKVTERKSSVPAEMQPNKSLLLKAMKDAHKSIETASQKIAVKAVVKPTVHHHDKISEGRRSLKHRLGTQHHEPATSRLLQSGRSIEFISRSSQESKRLFRRRSSEDRTFESEEVKHKRRKSSETKDKRKRCSAEEYPPTTKRHHSSEDCRPTQTDFRQVEITLKQHNKSTNERPDDIEEDVLEVLIESGADDSEFTDAIDVHGESSSSRSSRSEETMKYDTLHDSIHPKKSEEPNPKFVVTLDGVDPELLKINNNMTEVTSAPPASKNVVVVKPQRLYVDPVMINLSDDDNEEDMNSLATNATTTPVMPETEKIQEKCKFWPACKMGDQCPYTHPTTECLKFPNCHFGSKCLYLHPACKFDVTCTRPDCPYSHTMKKATTSVMPYVIQPIRVPVYMPRPQPVIPQAPVPRGPSLKDLNCRFFPRCTNMNCTFRHPKPCRYGIGCMNKDSCYFYHPNVPNKSQLKWTPGKQTRRFHGSCVLFAQIIWNQKYIYPWGETSCEYLLYMNLGINIIYTTLIILFILLLILPKVKQERAIKADKIGLISKYQNDFIVTNMNPVMCIINVILWLFHLSSAIIITVGFSRFCDSVEKSLVKLGTPMSCAESQSKLNWAEYKIIQAEMDQGPDGSGFFISLNIATISSWILLGIWTLQVLINFSQVCTRCSCAIAEEKVKIDASHRIAARRSRAASAPGTPGGFSSGIPVSQPMGLGPAPRGPPSTSSYVPPAAMRGASQSGYVLQAPPGWGRGPQSTSSTA